MASVLDQVVTGRADGVADIQNYLVSLQKEIRDDKSRCELEQKIIGAGHGGTATIFVDENGQCYAVQANPTIGNESSGRGDLVLGVGEMVVKDAQHTSSIVVETSTQMTESTVSRPDSSSSEDTGTASFPTVALVQNDSGEGEAGLYFVIVQQPNGEAPHSVAAEVSDPSVYDFTEGDESQAVLSDALSDGEDEKKVVVTMITKKGTSGPNATVVHNCNYCNYTTNKRYLLSRHLKTHSIERPHRCSICDRTFKTLASLHNHANTHAGVKPHPCKFCQASFTTSGELVRHIRYKHTMERPHKCSECDYSSVELSKLRRHVRAHTGERPFQCPHCTYASPDSFKLKRHLRIHTGERPYVCEICSARFTQSNSLKTHRAIHSGDKPSYQCELCPTTCGRKTDLRIHVQKLHTSDKSKSLKCNRCGATFSDRYSFKTHVKSHEGEKCYQCDLCPYASTASRHLESHMLIHTDQKPFKCEQCDQCFRQKQLLKRHVNLYHDPSYKAPKPRQKKHVCEACDRSFANSSEAVNIALQRSNVNDEFVVLGVLEMEDSDPLRQDVKTDTALNLSSSAQVLSQLSSMEGEGGAKLPAVDLMDVDGTLESCKLVERSGDGTTIHLKELPHSSAPGLQDDDDVMEATVSNVENSLRRETGIPMRKDEMSIQEDVENCFGFAEEDIASLDEREK
ncbi:unnamed protein product [Cyprideis torosa]|uniref:Uncharacterized protein n=1 Tax=Cyprideis torosa TaxID=163714 RepID=A0A7R8WBT8_9CRUS|nr:unnamed protein product [Cyprideis torosa]CAG0886811.1 unnamed protein product [Cyprideis torosa]